MAVEIERKFLVTGDAWREAPAVYFAQGYLSTEKSRTVRVRVAGEEAFLAIKGETQGFSRQEFEYPIPLADGKALLVMCEQPLIERYRHKIPAGDFVWEVDEFLGANAGLVVAEIELPSEDTDFPQPEWLGAEVTSDARYYNASLVKHLWSQW
jgi:adenylate cyclase